MPHYKMYIGHYTNTENTVVTYLLLSWFLDLARNYEPGPRFPCKATSAREKEALSQAKKLHTHTRSKKSCDST